MKQFNINLNKVAHELPLDLVEYIKTCTCREEIVEVLETALDNEYVQALDWLYSVIDAPDQVVKSSPIQFVSELLKVDPMRIKQWAFHDAVYEASDFIENITFYGKEIMIRKKDQVYFIVHEDQIGSYYIENVDE